MNKLDMEFLKLTPGSLVNVETRRGKITLNVRQDNELPKGMIFIPFCFTEAAANKLTNPQLDPFGKIPEFKYCAAKVEINNKSELLTENQSTYIPLGSSHRLMNPGKIPLILIEVQSGSYVGEDDIVRFQDKYGRSK